nr:acyltransferase [Microvirga splendida]
MGRVFEDRTNNFNLIRLVAAFLVLAGHSYPLTGKPSTLTAVFGYDPGQLGVAIFFIISGFLITRSAENRSLIEYTLARLLRIVPALAVVAFATAFIVGPIFTTVPLKQYFASAETYSYLTNAIPYRTQFTLPGLFYGLPISGGVNGSLWTLPLEAACYVILPVLLLAGLMQRYWVLGVTAAAAIALLAGIKVFGLSFGNAGPVLFGVTQLYQLAYYGMYFLIGAALWVHRNDIPFSWVGAVICLVLMVAARHTSYATLALYLGMPYLIMYLAFARPIAPVLTKKIGDLSYGTYLMAFPLQQSFVSLSGKTVGAEMLTLVVTLVVLPLAWLSWRYIEKPALNWKNGFRRPAATGRPEAATAL